MFVYHRAIYIGENVKDPERVKDMLNGGTALFDTFALCVDPEGTNLMDILHTPQLFKPVNARKRYTVVGLADGWLGSRALFVRILGDFLASGKRIEDFKAYFLE